MKMPSFSLLPLMRKDIANQSSLSQSPRLFPTLKVSKSQSLTAFLFLLSPLPLLAQTVEGESFDGTIPPPLPIPASAWWEILFYSPWFWMGFGFILLVALILKRWLGHQTLESPYQPEFPPLPEAMHSLDAILKTTPPPSTAEAAGEIWRTVRRYLSRRYRHPLEASSLQEIFFPSNDYALIPDTAQRRFLPLARVCEKLAFSRPDQATDDIKAFVENARDCIREDAREPYA